jgi:hypothetical protein
MYATASKNKNAFSSSEIRKASNGPVSIMASPAVAFALVDLYFLCY